jgi:hypothetical protein
MIRTLVLLIALAFAGVAQAQIKCWTAANGKHACGDTPPPGAKVTTVRTPAAPSAPTPGPGVAGPGAAGPGAASPASKAASKGPLTPAEREQEFRKRRAEAQKNAEKLAQDRKDAAAERENCERAREALRDLESGQRISRTDAKGERYFLDDAQREQEAARARELVKQSCN